MLDRDAHVGIVSEPRYIDVERGFLKFFATATGQTDPIYSDDEAARAAGHPAIPVPPTYFYSLNSAALPQRGGLIGENGMNIPVDRMLHGEQSFTYHRMAYAGDRITMVTTTSDIYVKKGGTLEFVVQDTRFENQHGELCADARQVIVVRRG